MRRGESESLGEERSELVVVDLFCRVVRSETGFGREGKRRTEDIAVGIVDFCPAGVEIFGWEGEGGFG